MAEDENSQWELSKENITPLRCGRKIDNLNVSLNLNLCDDKMIKHLEERRMNFERELRTYSGNDLLSIYHSYFKWTLQHFPAGGKESRIDVLVKDAVKRFVKQRQYCQDERLLDFVLHFLRVVDDSPDPFFHFMWTNGICTQISRFWHAWASYYESKGDTVAAAKRYQQGLDAHAEPKKFLLLKQEELQYRVVSATLQQSAASEANSLLAEADVMPGVQSRLQLSTLRQSSLGQVSNRRTGSAINANATISAQLTPVGVLQPINDQTSLHVFEDPMGEEASTIMPPPVPPPLFEAASLTLGAALDRVSQENRARSAGPWHGALKGSKSKPLTQPIRLPPTFEIFSDVSSSTPQLPIGERSMHWSGALTDHVSPLDSAMPNDAKAIIKDVNLCTGVVNVNAGNIEMMFRKDLVYGGTVEMSLEEIRAASWLKTNLGNEHTVSSVAVAVSSLDTSKSALISNTFCCVNSNSRMMVPDSISPEELRARIYQERFSQNAELSILKKEKERLVEELEICKKEMVFFKEQEKEKGTSMAISWQQKVDLLLQQLNLCRDESNKDKACIARKRAKIRFIKLQLEESQQLKEQCLKCQPDSKKRDRDAANNHPIQFANCLITVPSPAPPPSKIRKSVLATPVLASQKRNLSLPSPSVNTQMLLPMFERSIATRLNDDDEEEENDIEEAEDYSIQVPIIGHFPLKKSNLISSMPISHVNKLVVPQYVSSVSPQSKPRVDGYSIFHDDCVASECVSEISSPVKARVDGYSIFRDDSVALECVSSPVKVRVDGYSIFHDESISTRCAAANFLAEKPRVDGYSIFHDESIAPENCVPMKAREDGFSIIRDENIAPQCLSAPDKARVDGFSIFHDKSMPSECVQLIQKNSDNLIVSTYNGQMENINKLSSLSLESENHIVSSLNRHIGPLNCRALDATCLEQSFIPPSASTQNVALLVRQHRKEDATNKSTENKEKVDSSVCVSTETLNVSVSQKGSRSKSLGKELSSIQEVSDETSVACVSGATSFEQEVRKLPIIEEDDVNLPSLKKSTLISDTIKSNEDRINKFFSTHNVPTSNGIFLVQEMSQIIGNEPDRLEFSTAASTNNNSRFPQSSTFISYTNNDVHGSDGIPELSQIIGTEPKRPLEISTAASNDNNFLFCHSSTFINYTANNVPSPDKSCLVSKVSEIVDSERDRLLEISTAAYANENSQSSTFINFTANNIPCSDESCLVPEMSKNIQWNQSKEFSTCDIITLQPPSDKKSDSPLDNFEDSFENFLNDFSEDFCDVSLKRCHDIDLTFYQSPNSSVQLESNCIEENPWEPSKRLELENMALANLEHNHHVFSRLSMSLPIFLTSRKIKSSITGDIVEFAGLRLKNIHQIGAGFEGTVFRASLLSDNDDTLERLIALKVCRPATSVEFNSTLLVRNRLKLSEPSLFNDEPDMSDCIAPVEHLFFTLDNASVMLSPFHEQGTLLDLVNLVRRFRGNRLPEPAVAYLTLELLYLVESMHSRGRMLHADIKPDNLIFCGLPKFDLTESKKNFESSSILRLSSRRAFYLIDWGLALDLEYWGKDVSFVARPQRSAAFMCPEMRTGRPWRWQVDLFNLASTVYFMIHLDYMSAEVNEHDQLWRPSRRYKLPRSWQNDMWDRVLLTLMNSVNQSNEYPPLNVLRDSIQQYLFSNLRDYEAARLNLKEMVKRIY